MEKVINQQEAKRRYFNKYCYQRILFPSGLLFPVEVRDDYTRFVYNDGDISYLLLTPLSQLSIEDSTNIIIILKKLGIVSTAMINPQEYLLEAFEKGTTTINIVSDVVDYLRAKGYATRYYCSINNEVFKVEDLIKMGWIKIKGVNNSDK